MRIPKSAGRWASAMRRTPEGTQVVSNCEAEENVPPGIAGAFLTRLSGSFIAKKDPGGTMEDVLASMPSCDLSGPSTNLGMTLLTRFEPLARLPDLPSLRKAGISEQMLMRNPRLVDRIKEIPLGNPKSPRDIVWATREEDVAEDLRRGHNLSQVLNKLGVSKVASQPMYRAIYNASNAPGACHVPTVLDAGANHRFRPARKGASQGMTKPCVGDGPGYAEFVHGKCTVASPGIRVHRI